MNFVALDFETANSQRSSVCSLGIVVVQDGIIIEEAYWLVKPKKLQFDPYNTYIHGISAKDVMNEPEFCELWPKIKPYIENKIVIAHNASFDMSVLRYVLDEYGIPYPTLSYSCSVAISKKHWPDLPSHKLNSLSEYLGIKFKHHNALEDASACAKIVVQICSDNSLDSLESLINKFGFSMGGLYPGGYKSTSQKIGNTNLKSLKPISNNFDCHHPFYYQTFVFTGILKSMARKAAMQKVVDYGGSCSGSVTEYTNYLVIGGQDFKKFKDGLKSNKMKKAESLIFTGLDLKIISEAEFLKMI